MTAFSAGIISESRKIKSDTLNEKNFGANLNYLVTAFPIKHNKWTTSIGLMPYTAVNYKVQYTDVAYDANGLPADEITAQETGAGGLTQFYWSNGVRLHKNITVGLKAAYIFGPITNTYGSRTTNPDQAVPYVIQFKEKTTVKDFQFTGGFNYNLDSIGNRGKYKLNVGTTYSLQSKLNAKYRSEFARLDRNQNVLETDTISRNDGFVQIPGSVTVGVSYSRINKWTIGTEFNYQNWSNFRSINEDDEGLGESWRASLGGELTPDPTALDNYLKRVTYRVGLSYERYPFLVNNSQLKDFGINFGFSVPAGRVETRHKIF
jgi:hypothetical protein